MSKAIIISTVRYHHFVIKVSQVPRQRNTLGRFHLIRGVPTRYYFNAMFGSL